ncbi:hypothetical protein [Sphingomonas astaxanthinifaciens]|uniref:Lipoprotein n=1 Tax=Sphingomonas astaxanthinifaciens DSM 22298 TaxID=1123267 RepID=A0ABQ5Z6X4_9SPHN|nr:hypothetical protein [Sphingomonas astaxanthinifaciens]GLR47276.1 hypothetical protein GCM10007925_09870 [Sphingomonas astaxanthinifaciens DSM 22298]
MKRFVLLASCALAACSNQPAANPDNEAGPAINLPVEENLADQNAPAPAAPAAPANTAAPAAPGRATPEREVVSEGPIDPRSAQGAAQIVQTYFALIEAKKFAEAKKLWGSAASLAPDLSAYREYHAEVYKPGDTEGAAGSIYVTVPVKAYGVTAKGEKFEEPQVVTLRRVNDVDGSTAEQRRWHISKIDTPPSPH